MPDSPRPLTAPTVRGTYGVLLGAGAVVLSLGLLLPFVVADKPADNLASAGADTVSSSASPGTTAGTGPLATAGAAAAPAVGPTAAAGPGAGAASGPGAASAAGPAGGGGVLGGSAPVVPAASRGASDMGITRDAIKLGVLIPQDQSGEGGSFSDVIGSPKQQWNSYITELNAKGGILGRKITPVYRE